MNPHMEETTTLDLDHLPPPLEAPGTCIPLDHPYHLGDPNRCSRSGISTPPEVEKKTSKIENRCTGDCVGMEW